MDDHRVWTVTLRLTGTQPLRGADVQRFAQEQAAFLSSQDLGFGGEYVHVDVAAVEARGEQS